MNTTDKQRIMDKIERCLALSKSSNENEAATALRQAHALMEKYGIDDDDLQLADIKFRQTDSRLAKKVPSYQVMLASMIGKLFGCEPYMDYNFVRNQRVMSFAGLDMHTQIAAYAYDALLRQLKSARRDYMRDHLNRVRLAKNKQARADSFCHGWVATVRGLVKALVPFKRDNELIKKAMERRGITGTAKTVDSAANNKAAKAADDFFVGMVEGQKAKLNHAMHGQDRATMIE